MSDGLHLSLRQQTPIPLDARLHCAPGEVLALVGPSGSGKSTLLRSIAGLHQSVQGRIECNGMAWFDSAAGLCMPTQQRRVGMVFQQFALFPHLSALDNVAAAMLELPVQERRQRAQRWLARMHLQGLEGRLPRQLSGGQQQRVAVARALAREPQILLLDEPFSAVDRATREALYHELAELREELRMPVILVTHDLDEATLLADRMCVLDHGSILQTATPDDMLRAPASAAVARMLGMRNLFAGTLLRHEQACSVLHWQGHELRVARQAQVAEGSAVMWAVPGTGVMLLSSHAPTLLPLDNQVQVQVTRILALGEQLRVMLQCGSDTLTMSVPRHVAQRHALAEGQPLLVRLRGELMHLMPATPTPG
jgi:molybdate transport system ATP-binding protein